VLKAAGLDPLHYREYCTSAQAQALAAGPDGALWFAEGGTGPPNAYIDKIGRITASGATSEYPIPRNDWFTSAITSGPDGAIWFTGYAGARIGRVTTSGVVTMQDAKPVPDTFLATIAITAGPDAALWFTIQGGYIGRISTSGQVTTYLCNRCLGHDPTTIAVGSDRELWFTVYGQIRRVTTSGVFDQRSETPPNIWPESITAGPDGALWFTEDVDKIGRITTSGAITEFPIPAEEAVVGGFRTPTSITAGPDGALWFTETGDKIGRITTSGAVTEYTISARPSAIAVGPDRAIWFAEAGKRIGRLSFG
jgi:virginiamycin B lyase